MEGEIQIFLNYSGQLNPCGGGKGVEGEIQIFLNYSGQLNVKGEGAIRVLLCTKISKLDAPRLKLNYYEYKMSCIR